jgi:propanol-preferring alcohol dehydrogenase
MSRADARDFLKIANDLQIRPQVSVYSLDDANKAILAVRDESDRGSVVIVP